ncbi:11131_t:CDS:2 [Paraglomus occultum]|uniref:11131_t:CDS:1 n=1 Tax=Paraglomus occultum TaxID=144539 RepID=A0A9N9GHD4_9GLOM|nr:11131_t:CDS:2 [Paraglomus occultum]
MEEKPPAGNAKKELTTMEEIFKSYFQATGCFDYQAANKVAGKMKEINPGASTVLLALSRCEQSYTSLDSLKSKLWRSKDFLDMLYADAVKDIHAKVVAQIAGAPAQSDANYMTDVCRALSCFAKCRQHMNEVYRLTQSHPYLDDVTPILEKIKTIKEEVEKEPFLNKLGILMSGLEHEILIMESLLAAHKGLTSYNLKNTIVKLYTAKIKLSAWREIYSNQEYAEKSENRTEDYPRGLFTWYLFERNSKPARRNSGSPNLVQWMSRFHADLTAKMTLYFMQILIDRDKGGLNSIWNRVEFDYHGEITNFRKTSNALCVALVYEITDDVPFYPYGYICDGEQPAIIESDIDRFRCIYSYPKDQISHSKDDKLWSSMVSKLLQADRKPTVSPQRPTPIHETDKELKTTFYYLRIDSRVRLVVVHSSVHTSPDAQTIEFMTLIGTRLSNTHNLQSLSNFNDLTT